ncbi:hypothetical protein HG530_008971 [Fusarium avenaceum]|nr:hypothetical protein HG530_008971 [Fusarium avenaceum]
MAFGLFTKLQESFLNFDVRQRVDAAQLVDANLRKVMLACNMGKPVNDPGSLVITAVSKGTGSTSVLLALLRQQLQIRLIDETEDVLSPSDKILPSGDIIPDIGKSITPSTQQQLKLARLDIQVCLISVSKTLADDTSIMKLYQLLEVLEERNVRIGQALRQLVPLADRELDGLIADAREISARFLVIVELEERHEGLEEGPAGCRGIHDALNNVVQSLAVLLILPHLCVPPSALEKEILEVFVLRKILKNLPLLQFLCTENPVILPKHILGLGEWNHACPGLDLSILIQFLCLIPHAVLFSGVQLDKGIKITLANRGRLDLRLDSSILKLDQGSIPSVVCLRLVLEDMRRDLTLRPGLCSTVKNRLNNVGTLVNLSTVIVLGKQCHDPTLEVNSIILGNRRPVNWEEGYPKVVSKLGINMLELHQRLNHILHLHITKLRHESAVSSHE